LKKNPMGRKENLKEKRKQPVPKPGRGREGVDNIHYWVTGTDPIKKKKKIQETREGGGNGHPLVATLKIRQPMKNSYRSLWKTWPRGKRRSTFEREKAQRASFAYSYGAP